MTKSAAGKLRHRNKPAETAAQLFYLAVDHEALALRVFLKLSGFALLLELQETLDALADVLEIRESAADPASCHVRLAGTGRSTFDGGLGFRLSGNEQDGFSGAGDGCDERARGIETLFGLLEVENIVVVPGREKERCSGRVPMGAQAREMRPGVVEFLNVLH